MTTPCRTVWTLARPAVRRITRRAVRHYVRHKALHALVAVSVGCVGGPVAIVALLPPTVAAAQPFVFQPAAEGTQAQPIPEPSSVAIIGFGLLTLELLRRRKGL